MPAATYYQPIEAILNGKCNYEYYQHTEDKFAKNERTRICHVELPESSDYNKDIALLIFTIRNQSGAWKIHSEGAKRTDAGAMVSLRNATVKLASEKGWKFVAIAVSGEETPATENISQYVVSIESYTYGDETVGVLTDALDKLNQLGNPDFYRIKSNIGDKKYTLAFIKKEKLLEYLKYVDDRSFDDGNSKSSPEEDDGFNPNWYQTPATEEEYAAFKLLLQFFVKQLNINNGVEAGQKAFANEGEFNSTELIKNWNKYNGFELTSRFARGYQVKQDGANYLNYAWVNLNPHFDKETRRCVSLSISVKPDMNVIYKGTDYAVQDLDLDSLTPANEHVRKMFDELREQISKWQLGAFDTALSAISLEDQKERFATWLRGLKKADGSPLYAETYLRSLVNIAQKIDDLFDFPPFEHIYEIVDIFEFNAAADVIKTHPDFKTINKANSNGTISAMLTLYGKFLRTSITPSAKIRFKTTYKNNRYSMNRILFGAPGTGKSHTLNEDVQGLVNAEKATFERVTFHPEYSYASFVGCYKPVSSDEGIEYKYVAGPFMRVLVEAYKSGRTEAPRPHILLIEELNRARVAAVFGEVFQLLDRDADGVSEYEIAPSEDIKKYLADELGGDATDYNKIQIPNNMFLWATMNSADQGVFPMDTAFKRRWNFEYIGIDDNDGKVKSIIKIGTAEYDWNRLRKAINAKMSDLRINEDKLLGPYFISKHYFNVDATNDDANNAFVSVFKNKVLMYLFEDACKQKAKDMFEGCDHSRYSRICDAFSKKGVEIFGKSFQTEYYDKEK